MIAAIRESKDNKDEKAGEYLIWSFEKMDLCIHSVLSLR